MSESDQIEETEKTDESESPKKKGLKALLGNKKILIAVIAVVIVAVGAGGFLIFKSKKKSQKDSKKAAEEKVVEKTAADYFDHIAVAGPFEIELSDTGESAVIPVSETSGKTPAENVEGNNKDAEKKPDVSVHGEKSKDAQGENSEAEEVEVKTLRISLAFELSEPKLAKEMKNKASMIENDITEMIKDRKITELTSDEGKILLKNQLIANLNKMLESGKVRDLYITLYLIM